MKERTNQLILNKENAKDEFSFDICRTIEELNKLTFDFYISGGVIGKFFCKEHSRYIKDIDIVTKCDLKEVESIFRQHFKVECFYSYVSDLYFLEVFTCLVDIDGEIVQIDGTKINHFDKIKPELYKINDISFKGIPIEFLLATKIHALTSKFERPFKHLVDVYSATFIEPSLINKQEIRKYAIFFNDEENEARKVFKKPENTLNFFIAKDKSFSGSEILTTLQAGYNVSKEEMIETVNKWLSSI